MNFKDYTKRALATSVYPNMGDNLSYPALGLTGEAGEVADKIKKLIRDKSGILDEASRKEIIKEAGDVLWYLAAISFELNTTLENIAKENIKKLEDRQARGVLHGEGDNR
jgi:NTP pyrophosphatase (non-canonical NTP hydrolase)